MNPSESEIVERELYIQARPETVFPFLVDPAKMVQWSGAVATLDPRPGGLYRVVVEPDWIERGEFIEIVPNRRVVFTFGWERVGAPLAPGSTRVEIDLSPHGDGTLLRLRHRGVPAEHRASHAAGWDHYLPRLQAVAEGRDPGADPYAEGHPDIQAAPISDPQHATR